MDNSPMAFILNMTYGLKATQPESLAQLQQANIHQANLRQFQQSKIYDNPYLIIEPTIYQASPLSMSEMIRISQEDALALQRERYTPSEMRIRRCKAENVTAANSELMSKSIDILLDAMDVSEAWKEVNDIAPGWIDPPS